MQRNAASRGKRVRARYARPSSLWNEAPCPVEPAGLAADGQGVHLDVRVLAPWRGHVTEESGENARTGRSLAAAPDLRKPPQASPRSGRLGSRGRRLRSPA